MLCTVIGCRNLSDGEWQSRYEDARKKLWYGSYQEAYQQADRNVRKAEGKAPAWAWRFLLLEAQALQFQGKSKDALALLQGEVPSNLPIDVRARKKIVQGDTFCRLGNLDKAKPLLLEAASLIPGEDPGLQAELALTRGRCAMSADPGLALQSFNAASNLAHGHDEFIEATGLLNAGFMLFPTERYDEAIERFQQGAKATASPLLQEKLLGNLGWCHSQLGDWTRALPFSEEAERLAGEIKNNGDRVKWLIDVGREHFSQLEYSEAEAAYTKALSIAQESQDRDGQANALHHLVQLALKTHDLNKAEDYARQEEALHAEGARNAELLQDKAEIATARQDLATAERLLQEILHRPDVKPVSRWRAQSDLAAVYVAQKKFGDAEQAFQAAIAMVDEMRRKIPEERRISFLDEAPFYDQYVKFLISQKKTEAALAFAERGRSPTLAEALGIGPTAQSEKQTFAPLQAMLKKRRQVALAYWLAEEESYLWAITPTGITLFHLRPEMEIKKQVEDYAAQIADRREIEESPAGRKLYDMLVGPAKELISKASSVVIVPHRSLYNLSFEALLVPAAKPEDKPHYWIEDVDVESASFLGLLAKPDPPRAGRSKDLLLMGAPVEASTDFPVLEHASEEMNKLAARFPAPGMAVIAGRDATPEAYASNHPGDFRLIHFVTHGTASTERPLDSAIILSPGPNKSYKLYARSIKDVKLHADLVTISACSGAGKRQYSGEGLVGLAWSFMRAGAHQVVAALWDVDDASSPQLMDDFYSELSKGKSVASALRHAKLNMLHSPDFHRRPFYWASLQLYTGA